MGGTAVRACGAVRKSPLLEKLDDELSAATAHAVSRRETGDKTSSVAELSLHEQLPLPTELKCKEVDGSYVWIAVREAALVALTPAQNEIMQKLAEGAHPKNLLGQHRWEQISDVVGRLASAGLLRGIGGYVDRKPPRATRFARLHLTKSCQLECAHCYADSSPRVDRSRELPTSRWSQFLDDFAKVGGEQVLYTGGEALLHSGCLELMAQSKRLGLHVTLFSNGLLIPKVLDRLIGLTDQIQISLDGPDAASNNAIRGPNTFGHILKAIDVLARGGFKVRIGMTAQPLRWETWVAHFSEIRNRYSEFPNVTFKLSYGIMSYGRGKALDKTEVADRHVVRAFINEVNGTHGPTITRLQAGCGYAEQIVIGPDGMVYPCHLLDSPICHIEDHSLTKVARQLESIAYAFSVDNVEGCKDCEIRYLCGGSCRVLAGRARGSRLLNLCSAEAKAQKYRNLAATYAAQNPTEEAIYGTPV